MKKEPQRPDVQPWLFQLSRDLAECLPVSHAVQLRAYRPLAPLNLRVAGDGHCPTYSTGQNIALTWDQSSPRRAVREPERDCPPHADHVIAEVWDAAGEAKKGEWAFDEAGSGTIPNAGLVAALGSESSFVLKAYNQRGSFRSLTSAQLTVTGPHDDFTGSRGPASASRAPGSPPRARPADSDLDSVHDAGLGSLSGNECGPEPGCLTREARQHIQAEV